MDYYISLFGNDSNTGVSKQQPWQTVDRVNSAVLNAGDSVWFHSYQTFKGNLTLTGIDGSNKPITFRSYGEGRATIDAGTGTGLFAKNTCGICIIDLNFVGAGTERSNGSGIWFINTLPVHKKLKNVHIDKVNVSGFKHAGISIAAQPIDSGWCGFNNVKITHANVFDNGDAGISCNGVWKPEAEGYSHHNVYIGYCRVYRNEGIAGKGAHSGNGIVLGQVYDGTIEYCVAYENGRLNDCEVGGPVGIWTWDSNRVLMQFNESHHNRTGSSKDGGGFDLDGGVRNSIVQYNYSHDNEGAGYLLAQFEGARTFHSNVIRYNVSENDGLRNSYGSIHFWSTGSNGGITSTTIYGNKVITGKSINGKSAAVDCMSEGIHNICFYNNIFRTDGKALQIRGKSNPGVVFKSNSCVID